LSELLQVERKLEEKKLGAESVHSEALMVELSTGRRNEGARGAGLRPGVDWEGERGGASEMEARGAPFIASRGCTVGCIHGGHGRELLELIGGLWRWREGCGVVWHERDMTGGCSIRCLAGMA
jgi:hypothetical protein